MYVVSKESFYWGLRKRTLAGEYSFSQWNKANAWRKEIFLWEFFFSKSIQRDSLSFTVVNPSSVVICWPNPWKTLNVKEWVSCYTFGWEKDIAEGRRLSSYFPLYLFLLSIPLAIIQWLRKTAPGIQKSLMKPAFEWLQ